MTLAETTTQIKFVSRVVNAGTSRTGKRRHIIGVPDSDLAKVADLAGKHVLVTVEAIL